MGIGVQGAGCRVQGAGRRVQGAGCRVQGAGFRGEGRGVTHADEEMAKGGERAGRSPAAEKDT